MTFRPNDFSAIAPGNPGYRTFEKKGKIDLEEFGKTATVDLRPPQSVFLTEEEIRKEEQAAIIARIDEGKFNAVREDLQKYPEMPPAKTVSELTITIRDEERSLKTKHLLYDNYTVNAEDPVIKEIIAQALQEFNGEPSAVRIRINLVVL